jgi:hypothetical protein
MRFLGKSDDVIDHAVAVGRLHRVFHGVYAVGHPRKDQRSRLMAAVLACGEGAVVSHRSATGLLGLVDERPIVVDMLAPKSRGRGEWTLRSAFERAAQRHRLDIAAVEASIDVRLSRGS